MLSKAATRIGYPWKNNRGIQYDIASFDSTGAATMENGNWHWKLLTADITEKQTPFSLFPGILREFVVADGDGVVLNINGIENQCPCGSITRFKGDADTNCELMNGPVKALNLIVREGGEEYFFKTFDAASGELTIDINPCIVVAIKGNAAIRTSDCLIVASLELLDAIQVDSCFVLQIGTIAVFKISPTTTDLRADGSIRLVKDAEKTPQTQSVEFHNHLTR